jgi:hypothetical protein
VVYPRCPNGLSYKESYFDGFLEEMGKDHYSPLKKGLMSLGSKLLGKSTPEVVTIGSPGKVSATRLYSLNYSIIAEAEDGQRFKLLLQQNASEQQYEKILENFLEFFELPRGISSRRSQPRGY